jgi:hypothetical protein
MDRSTLSKHACAPKATTTIAAATVAMTTVRVTADTNATREDTAGPTYTWLQKTSTPVSPAMHRSLVAKLNPPAATTWEATTMANPRHD